MTDSLAGACLKLNRARDHMEVLRDELAAFNAGEPYRIAHEPNADGSEHIFRAKVRKEPPPFLSVVIGDALQNMRSTLEHLAWGLTPLRTQQTDERSIGFPICTSRQAFEQTDRNSPSGYNTRTGMHKIWTMPTKVRAAIQQLQPYKSRNPDEHPLFLLNELARVDRHQSLSVVGAVSPSVTYGWRKRGTHGPFVMDPAIIKRTDIWLLKPFEQDAVLGDFRFNESEMEVEFKSPPHITFRNEEPAKSRHVLGTLTSIRRHIESVVIPKLERFF